MIKHPNTLLLSFVLTSLVGADRAGAQSFARMMSRAVKAHEQAADLQQEIAALDRFRDVCVAHPDEWLGHYWTSYLCTQVLRLIPAGSEVDGLTRDDLAIEALEHYRLADEHSGERDADLQSDFHALRGFLCDFEAMVASEAEAGAIRAKKEEEYRAALTANPDSPLMNTLVAIDLIYRDYRSVVAGKRLLQRAQEQFAKEKNRSKTTHWASDFVVHWLGQAEQRLRRALAEGDSPRRGR